jgi:hypothetical protein
VLAARLIGLLAAAALLSGCWYAYGSLAAGPRYGIANRPHPSYYCYDCHGYRFFDPYYDWCPNYGFVYRWERSPRVVALYRERYLALKRKDPTLGRFQYPNGYRVSRRYREPRDYETWLRTRESKQDRGGFVAPPSRETRRPRQGSKPRKHRDSSEAPSAPGSRPRPQGGQP